MRFNPDIHHRRSIRLRGYDYAHPGFYFITLCAHERQPLFGEIVDSAMVLSEAGVMVAETWQWLSHQYDYVQLDEFVVMPNHMHGILIINDTRMGDSLDSRGLLCKGDSRIAPTKHKSLGRLIGAFKTVSTKHINQQRDNPGAPVWQRNYHEHIIRHEQAHIKITEYIRNNPSQWREDIYYG